jgi:hypothetical protein
MMFARQDDKALILVAQPDDLRLELLGFQRPRRGSAQVALDFSPHGEDDLCFTLVRHEPQHIDRRMS